MMFDRICADNGIRHILTAPYSPTTTGKIERLHKTMRAEFFTRSDGTFATMAEFQAALDTWVREYNTTRPHSALGGQTPLQHWEADPPRSRRYRPGSCGGCCWPTPSAASAGTGSTSAGTPSSPPG